MVDCGSPDKAVGIGGDLRGSAGTCGDLPVFVEICGDLWGSVWPHTLRHSENWLWGPLSSQSYGHYPLAKFSPGLDGLRFVARPSPTLRTDGLPHCEHCLQLSVVHQDVVTGSLACHPPAGLGDLRHSDIASKSVVSN